MCEGLCRRGEDLSCEGGPLRSTLRPRCAKLACLISLLTAPRVMANAVADAIVDKAACIWFSGGGGTVNHFSKATSYMMCMFR